MKISVNYPKRFKKLPQQGSCYGFIIKLIASKMPMGCIPMQFTASISC